MESDDHEARIRDVERLLAVHVAECDVLRREFVEIAADVKALRDRTTRWGGAIAVLLVALQIWTMIR